MSDREQKKELLTTNAKALAINLAESRYGTFAEIGAGQEVARHFFQAGGAAMIRQRALFDYHPSPAGTAPTASG